MDTFTRKYSIGLIIASLIALTVYLSNRDPRVGEINQLLASDSILANYPYQFEVLAIENDVAIMKSPRSAEVPVMRFLRVAFPELRRLAVDDPAMMAAQDELAARQGRAAELAQDKTGIRGVRWEFDHRWFEGRGVFVTE